MRRHCPLLVCLAVVGLGCHTTLTGGYWLPTLAGQSSSGGGALDFAQDLGVVADEKVPTYEIIGGDGMGRTRLSYWVVSGQGAKVAPSDYAFASTAYTAGDQTQTDMSLEAFGIIWEPGFDSRRFSLRFPVGLDFMQFRMQVDNITTGEAGVVDVPDPTSELASLGITYLPVPLYGLEIGIGITHWLAIVVRGQTVSLQDFMGMSASFLVGDVGLIIGKPKGHLFGKVGYNYFEANCGYGTVTAAALLQGLTASVSLRF